MSVNQSSDEETPVSMGDEELTMILVSIAKHGLKNSESRSIFISVLGSLGFTTEQIFGCLERILDETEDVEMLRMEDEIPPGEQNDEHCCDCGEVVSDNQGWKKPCPNRCANVNLVD